MIWIRKCVPLLKTLNHIWYFKSVHKMFSSYKEINVNLFYGAIAFSDKGSTRTYLQAR